MEKENKSKKKETAGGLLFIGCMFIGMGLGYMLGNMGTGLFVGMGSGFVAFGIVYLIYKDQ